eukprot:2609249-Ditylum_brightwellii.AAC.1
MRDFGYNVLVCTHRDHVGKTQDGTSGIFLLDYHSFLQLLKLQTSVLKSNKMGSIIPPPHTTVSASTSAPATNPSPLGGRGD